MSLKIIKLMLSVSVFIPSLVFANDFVIKNVKNEAFPESNFPFFSSDKYPQSASNINTFLQYRFLEGIFKESDFASKSLSPFKGEPAERDAYIYEFTASQYANYIDLSIYGESCSAYCESYTNSYIFDVYSGQLVTLIDLLAPSSLDQLGQKIAESNKEKLEPYIKHKPAANADEYLVDMYIMYKSCYERRFAGGFDEYNKIDAQTSFSLVGDKLVVTQGRCSSHAERALDNISSFVNEFSFNELQPYLTDDAKLYLSNKKHQLAVIKTPVKILHGKIANKYPITVLRLPRGAWVYWYEKYKTPIELSPAESKIEDNYILREGEHNGVDKWVYSSEFRVKDTNGVFNGVFVRLSDNKEMDVTFK